MVLFGDPDDGDAFPNIAPSDVKTYCFETDLICDGLPIVLPTHLAYAVNAPDAARFVQSNVQV